MSIRKCIYTNKEAKSKDHVLPKSILDEEIHNWCNQAPSNTNYLQQKLNNIPSELEMQANELFHLLELAKLRVKFFEEKLSLVQQEINKDYKEPIKNEISHRAQKIEKQKEQIIVEKAIVEDVDKKINEFFNTSKSLWD